MVVFLTIAHYFGEKSEELQLIYWLISLIGSAYFLFVHPKIFKARLDGAFAGILAFLCVGWGQAYNRQPFKAVLAVVLYAFVSRIATNDEFSDGIQVLFYFGYLAILIADANLSSNGSNKRIVKKNYKNLLEKRTVLLSTYSDQNHLFGLDTKMLLYNADLLTSLLAKNPTPLVISKQVFKDLDTMKKSKNGLISRQVQMAFNVLEVYQKKDLLRLIASAPQETARKLNLSNTTEEITIATYLHEFNNGVSNLIYLANDDVSKIIAHNAGLPVVEIG